MTQYLRDENTWTTYTAPAAAITGRASGFYFGSTATNVVGFAAAANGEYQVEAYMHLISATTNGTVTIRQNASNQSVLSITGLVVPVGASDPIVKAGVISDQGTGGYGVTFTALATASTEYGITLKGRIKMSGTAGTPTFTIANDSGGNYLLAFATLTATKVA